MTTTTKTSKVVSKASKVANALVNGAELTAKQITSRYGVKNVRAVISQLRSEGSSFDGESYMKYMLGTPTRTVVAAGYKALRSA